MRKFLSFLLCLAIGLPGGARQFEPKAGSRSGSPQSKAPDPEARLSVDSTLLENAERVGENGRTPVADWIVRHVFGAGFRPQEINAVGRRLVNSVMEAPDRVNVSWKTENGVILQVESASLGAGVQFSGGKFLTFSDKLTNPAGAKIGQSPLREMTGFAQHHGGRPLSPEELTTYRAILGETILQSPERLNIQYTDHDGTNFIRVEARDMGMGFRYRISPEAAKLVQAGDWERAARLPIPDGSLDYVRLEPDGRWMTLDGKPAEFPAVPAAPRVVGAEDVGADLAAKPNPGRLDRVANRMRQFGSDVRRWWDGLGKTGKNPESIRTGSLTDTVHWVDERAAMSPQARDYQSGAPKARSNRLTRNPLAPKIRYRADSGVIDVVRFDGLDGDVLVDRKLSVTTFPKSESQALRQSKALAQNGLRGRWEVPTQTDANRAQRLFRKLGVKNIDVQVVAR